MQFLDQRSQLVRAAEHPLERAHESIAIGIRQASNRGDPLWAPGPATSLLGNRRHERGAKRRDGLKPFGAAARPPPRPVVLAVPTWPTEVSICTHCAYPRAEGIDSRPRAPQRGALTFSSVRAT